jgi:hypothetical protein
VREEKSDTVLLWSMLIFVVTLRLSVQSSPENVKVEALRYPARNIRYVGILLLNNPRECKFQEFRFLCLGVRRL